MKHNDKAIFWICIVLIILSTAIAFSNSLENGFVALDDDAYVYANKIIRNINGDTMRAFFTEYYIGMYAPVTMISYAVDYKFGGQSPAVYHRANLILHLFNVALVFFFLYRLNGQIIIAVISALFFGIHPLHVESVAWISARKDLLYAFFYLGGLIAWICYRDMKKRRICYYLSIVFFILSLLSKSAAVTFPIILILIDYYIAAGRSDRTHVRNYTVKTTIKSHLDKSPFFILSIAFGALSLFSQRVIGADVDYVTGYTIIDRVFLGAYAFSFYLVKSVIPSGLSALHPMPMKPDGMLPAVYYLSILVPIGFAGLLVKVFQLDRNGRKDVLFGLLFFFFTIALILFIPVGQAVVAERYTYLPYIGIYIVMARCYLCFGGLCGTRAPRARFLGLTAIVITAAVLFSCMTYSRNRVWKDSLTLFSDVIKKNPDAALAYNNRGNIRMEQKDFKGAREDFDKAITLNYFDTYTNRGILMIQLGDYQKALEDLNRAAALSKADRLKVLYNRGLVRLHLDDFQGAEEDFSGAIRINPQYVYAWNSRGLVRYERLSDFNGAIQDFNEAISLNPADPYPYYNRGNLHVITGKISEALADFDRAIDLAPQFTEAHFNKGVALLQSGNRDDACRSWQKVTDFGVTSAEELLIKYCMKYPG